MKPIINALDRLAEIGRMMRESETRPVETKTAGPAANFGRDEAEPTAEPPTPERADG